MKDDSVAAKEQFALNIIRTDTVISRLPAHNLFGQGAVNIVINRKDEEGHTKLAWKVSFNSDLGEAGQLAYRLETLIINRRIDEQGRPVPTMLRLGSLSDICHELGINPSGANTNSVKRALQQNAGALITANLSYKAVDGAQHKLEATFTKYSVAFRGDELPSGEKSDGVIILLNEQYRRVLNRVATRPLDFQYCKKLTPSAQRFYEIISYQIYAALKYGYPEARISYSDYCAYSGQPRQSSNADMNKRMYKIHSPHLKSGYISKVTYHPCRDLDGAPDWVMAYVPGPQAIAEFERFNRRLYTEDHSGDVTGTSQDDGGKSSSLPVRLLQHFHLLARGVRNYRPPKNGKEEKYAKELIDLLGEEGAWFFVEFALVEAKKTSFQMVNLGGAMQYLDQASAKWREVVNAKEVNAKSDEDEKSLLKIEQELDELVSSRVKGLSAEEFNELFSVTKNALIKSYPRAASWEEDVLHHQVILGIKNRIKEELLGEGLLDM